jgi:hypothetical protein
VTSNAEDRDATDSTSVSPPQTLHSHPLQFSIAKILAITGVYAVLLAHLTPLPIRLVIAGTAFLTCFVALDFVLAGRGTQAIPRWCRVTMFLAYYLSAFTVTLALCGYFHLTFPEPTPSRLFWEVVVGLFTGSFLQEMFRPLAIFLVLMIYFLATSTVGFIVAAVACRHYRSAWLLVLISLPGAALVAYAAIGSFFVNQNSWVRISQALPWCPWKVAPAIVRLRVPILKL